MVRGSLGLSLLAYNATLISIWGHERVVVSDAADAILSDGGTS